MKRLFAIIFSCFIFSGIAYADLNDGLVAYYPFDGNINDASGNENHGTVYGTTETEALTEDRFGNPDSAFSFDGVDDYIEVPDSDSLDVTGGITIGAWINIAEPLGGGFPQHYVVDSRDGQGGGYGINVDTNTMQFWVGGNYPTFPVNIQAGKWHHIAGTYDGDFMNLYIEGVLTDSILFATDFTPSTYSLYIGQRFNYIERFHGIIDDLRIYDRVLSESEIYQLYDELYQRIERLESQVDDLTEQNTLLEQRITDIEEAFSGHTHTYQTGKGKAHNEVETSTSIPE